jgi:hypothetical protein
VDVSAANGEYRPTSTVSALQDVANESIEYDVQKKNLERKEKEQ